VSRRAALAVCALFAFPAQADVWDRLVGRWRGGGEVRGMSADVELEFRTALGGKGRHLAFVNRMTATDGKQWLFQAEALYLCEPDGRCRGQWFDSRGMSLPLTAAADLQRVVVEWGDAATERGRTTYALTEDGALGVTDEALGKDGAWRTFGRTRLMRSSAAGNSADSPPGDRSRSPP
jgi:hypothetical protein